jgi:hypothetical protein
MVDAEIKIKCKNRHARSTVWTKTFPSEEKLVASVFAFGPKEIECPTCHTLAFYSALELSADYSVTETEPETAGLNS